MNSPEVVALEPGMVFEFTDITQLPPFEDKVIESLDLRLNPSRRSDWANRIHIRDTLKPPRFNGNLTDITLEVMEDPYAQLMSARERGWKFAGGAHAPRGRAQYYTPEEFEKIQLEYAGFVFSALAKSTGRGVIGTVDCEIWYYSKILNFGIQAVRKMTQPKWDRKKFEKAHTDARRVSYSTTQYALRHPYRG